MISIDGSIGEGGGQIIRTALALSLCLGKPFHIKNIRVKRKKPGLAWQHLAAVHAAQAIGNAKVEGAEHKSTELNFYPQGIHGGQFHFDIGTAGSTSLVIQTILPALLMADYESEILLTGGTHNPMAPSFDFLDKCFFNVLRNAGANINAQLLKPGFFPKGGGQVKLNIQPNKTLDEINITERGEVLRAKATASVAGLPLHIAERELNTIQQHLTINPLELYTQELSPQFGPGNVLILEIQSEHITEVFTAYGQKHKPAEKVAKQLVSEAQAYLDSKVAVGLHLADQLLIPMALQGKGQFITHGISSHTQTNIEVIKQFTSVEFVIEKLAKSHFKINVTKT